MKKIIASSFLIFIIHLLFLSISWAETMFIYNPGGKTAYYQKAKAAIEDHFQSMGMKMKVYVFISNVDYQKALERLNPDVAIVASFYTKGGTIILSGHSNGSLYFKKVLVTSKRITSIKQLYNKSIATTSVKSTKKIQAKTRNVIVRKDIDAIMALAFKQVDGAIVSEDSFNYMKRINPNAKDLKIQQVLEVQAYPKVIIFPRGIAKKSNYIRILRQLRSRIALAYFRVSGFK